MGKILAVIFLSFGFSCQSINEADRIDEINPYGIYDVGQSKPSRMHDARKSSPAPAELGSYSFKPIRSANGKFSKTAVQVEKRAVDVKDSSHEIE